MNEIERKFLVTKLPNIPVLESYDSERYLLLSDKRSEERITHSGDKFFYEKKRVISETERTRDKHEISENEFNSLKTHARGRLVRETLVLNKRPKIVIQVYKEEYEGFMRAEIEFESQEAADRYEPEAWMGKEITGKLIARDSSLSDMTRNEMFAEINA